MRAKRSKRHLRAKRDQPIGLPWAIRPVRPGARLREEAMKRRTLPLIALIKSLFLRIFAQPVFLARF